MELVERSMSDAVIPSVMASGRDREQPIPTVGQLHWAAHKQRHNRRHHMLGSGQPAESQPTKARTPELKKCTLILMLTK